VVIRWLTDDDRRKLAEAAEERRVLAELEERHGWRSKLPPQPWPPGFEERLGRAFRRER
jgi:hypothetical protein